MLGKNQNSPIPQGKYLLAKRFGSIVYTSGMTPRKNGILIKCGKVEKEYLSDYKKSVEQATYNALIASKQKLKGKEKLEQIIFLTVYINADDTFDAHSTIADYASEYLKKEMGDTKGIGSRVAIGVNSLPSNAPIEISLVVSII